MLLAIGLTSAIFLTGCAERSPEEACNEIVDGFARSWERCGRGTYDVVKKSFGDAFQCAATKNYDGDKVDKCVSELNSIDCNAVKSGVFPSACGTPCPPPPPGMVVVMKCPPGPLSR